MEYDIPVNSLVLLKPSVDERVTQVRRIILEVLRGEGSMPFHLLAQRVAGEVHRLELREGAWMLDLGMFRSSLFIPSVAEEIKAGDGILWEIKLQSYESKMPDPIDVMKAPRGQRSRE